MAGYAARCSEHGLSTPCLACAQDHVAGDDHAPGSHTSTCRRCRTRTKKPNDHAAHPARRPRLAPDFAALAANDDTLTHLTEV